MISTPETSTWQYYKTNINFVMYSLLDFVVEVGWFKLLSANHKRNWPTNEIISISCMHHSLLFEAFFGASS